MKLFKVRSTEENYRDEVSDIKNNTARFTDDWDKSRWDDYYSSTHIKVVNRDTKEAFVREIRHKCKYLNIIIVTWKEKLY